MSKREEDPEPAPEAPAEAGPQAEEPAVEQITTPRDLPNASSGKPYEVALETFLFGENAARISWFNLHLPEDVGLAYDSESGFLAGIPRAAGEFKLVLEFLLDRQPSMAPASQTTVNLVVNPDPRDLWKDLPSDAAGLYAKTDTDFSRLTGQNAILVAASQRGRSHAHIGGYRDDDFAISTLDLASGKKFFCFAVADGAGSAELSRQGSAIACQHAVANCKRLLGGAQEKILELVSSWAESREAAVGYELHHALYEVLVTAAHQAFTAIVEASEAHDGSKPRDFHTTILLTIACKLDSGSWFFATFSIGDGGVAVYLRGEAGTSSVTPLSKPDSGEFAGQTSFMTMPELWEDAAGLLARIHFDVVPEFTALFSMTDGVSDPLFETDSNFESPESWDRFWEVLTTASDYSETPVDLSPSNPKIGEQLRDWLDFFSKGNHDDRTLAILVPGIERSKQSNDE